MKNFFRTHDRGGIADTTGETADSGLFMETIQYHNEDDEIIARNNLVAVFFSQAPYDTFSPEIEQVFDAWTNTVPPDALAWSLLGEHATTLKPFNTQTIGKCKSILDPAQVRKREISCFEISGPEKYGPSYAFITVGSHETDEDIANFVEMRFPTEFIQTGGIRSFIDFIVKCASLLPYDSGYASYSLCWGIESEKDKAGEIIVPLALTNHGYDINTNDWTRFNIGRKSRGARWMTFVGNALLNKIGSRGEMKNRLGDGIEIIKAGKGLAFQAGNMPESGKEGENESLPLLRSVAALIEPISLFNDMGLEVLFNKDAEKIDRWEKRFLS